MIRAGLAAASGALMLLACGAAGPSTAATSAPAAVVQPPPVTPPEDMVVTHGQVEIAGKPLRYTVHTGMLPIYDNDTAELAARMFVIAYTVHRPPGAPPRPLTFVWGGGPGSSSSEVHLMGFGPKGFRMPDTYPQWRGQPAQIEDRPETWLTVSDLVFVDPIGTGYSRAVTEAWRDRLYTTLGDAEAVAEAIRVYRTRFQAFGQPLFIAGESYGTTRAMEVAGALARRRTPLDGVILISGFYDAGQKVDPALREALQVPMFTAIAWYHRRLPPDLQSLPQAEAMARAEQWARDDYAPALAHPDALTAEQRASVMAGLTRYTGIDPRFVDAKTLVLSKDAVTDHLMQAQGLELGRYDGRMSMPHRPSGQIWSPREDASLLPMVDLMEGYSPALIEYLRDTLGYRSDLLYRGPWGGSFHPEPYKTLGPLSDDWMAYMWNHGAALHGRGSVEPESTPPPLEAAMISEPRMLVWSISGLYDQSCAERNEQIAETAPSLRARVRASCYPAGHMVYTDAAVRRQMQRDFARFVHDAVAAR